MTGLSKSKIVQVGTVLWASLALVLCQLPLDTVDLRQGLLRGFVRVINGRNVYYFLGVPYAEPPTGDRRFRPSIPHNGWTVSK